MIYTIRFWRYDQWNYIPDEPVNDPDKLSGLLEKYIKDISDFQFMVADVSNNKPCIWKVYEESYKEP